MSASSSATAASSPRIFPMSSPTRAERARLMEMAKAASPLPWDSPGYSEVWTGKVMLAQFNDRPGTDHGDARYAVAAANTAAALAAQVGELVELLREALPHVARNACQECFYGPHPAPTDCPKCAGRIYYDSELSLRVRAAIKGDE